MSQVVKSPLTSKLSCFANIDPNLHNKEERGILEKISKESLTNLKNVVILHTCPQGTLKYGYAATFTGKVESYLQYNSIPYTLDTSLSVVGLPMSKIPWITLNGIHTADSEIIIQRLNYEYNIDNDSHLTPKQRAISGVYNESMDRLYFIDIYRRYMDDENCEKYFDAIFKDNKTQSDEARKGWQTMMRDQLWSQGIGRFNGDVVYDKLSKYIDGVLDYMIMNHNNSDNDTGYGTSKYFFGNDRLSSIDFSLYGQFGSMYSLPQLKFVNLSSEYENKYQNILPRKKEMMRYIKDVYQICQQRSRKISCNSVPSSKL